MMKPDAQYIINLKKDEQDKIENMVREITPAEKEQIKLDNELLEQEQKESKDYNNLLPILKESDLNPEVRNPSLRFISWPDTGMKERFIKERYIGNSPLANSLTYVRLLGIQRAIPGEKELYYLPLAFNILTDLGIRGQSVEEFDTFLKKTCGGLSVDSFLNLKDQKSDFRVQLATWALDEKIGESIDLFRKILLECNWDDQDRIRTLIGQSSTNSLGSIASNGHIYAAMRAAAKLGKFFEARECLSGLKQVMFQQRLLAACEVPRNMELISKHLQHISHSTINQINEWRSAVIRNDNAEDFDLHDKLLVNLPPTEPSFNMVFGDEDPKSHFPLNTSYAAKCFLYNNHKLSFEDRAAIQIITRLISSKILHPLIREQGGAYGSGMSFDNRAGLITLTSYRDPTPQRSVEIFSDLEKLISMLADLHTSDCDDYILREVKLSAFQQLDAPVDLSVQGLHRFKTDLEDEEIYRLKKAILEMSWSKALELGQNYLLDRQNRLESDYILC